MSDKYQPHTQGGIFLQGGADIRRAGAALRQEALTQDDYAARIMERDGAWWYRLDEADPHALAKALDDGFDLMRGYLRTAFRHCVYVAAYRATGRRPKKAHLPVLVVDAESLVMSLGFAGDAETSAEVAGLLTALDGMEEWGFLDEPKRSPSWAAEIFLELGGESDVAA